MYVNGYLCLYCVVLKTCNTKLQSSLEAASDQLKCSAVAPFFALAWQRQNQSAATAKPQKKRAATATAAAGKMVMKAPAGAA